jgi:hypothetical protein
MAQKVFCLLKDDEREMEVYHIQAIDEDEAIRKCIAKQLVDIDALLGTEAYEDCQPEKGDTSLDKVFIDNNSDHDSDDEETSVIKHTADIKARKEFCEQMSSKDFKKRLELSHLAHFDCPRYTWLGEITILV